jgi:hypothetical protein
MNNSLDESDVNHRADQYLIARSVSECASCGGATPVVALCLPPGHVILDPEEDSWDEAATFAFIFHVGFMPSAVERRLLRFAPGYGRNRHQTSGWENRCEFCARPISDEDLFSEPGGAFLPTSAAEARRVRLTWVDEEIELAAGGYALEPQFFRAMVRE